MDRTCLIHVLILSCLIYCVTTISVDSESLLGCGNIVRPSRIYPYSPANYDYASNTPSNCIQSCSSAGYVYATVSAGQFCFCGSITTNITLLNLTTTMCQVLVCAGNSTFYCGDFDYELVYSSFGVIDSASMVLIGGALPTDLQINQNYQFNLDYKGSVNFINYLVDFGDGTKTGWFSGTLNSTTTITHTFSKTGQFSISVAARSLVGMKPVISAITVKVFDRISSSDVSMTCPNVTTTRKTVSCIFTYVRGTNLAAQVNYNWSTPLYSIPHIPNVQYYTYGSSSVTNYPTIDVSANLLTTNDIAILPQNTIHVASRIASIQFYSSGAGTFNIYLLRRTCTLPMMYCYDTNTCGNCIHPYALQCSSSIYTTTTQSCVNSTLSQRYQQSIYSGAQFAIIAQWTITTSGPGYQQIIANSTSNMMNRTALVGDILAFKGLFIAKEISTDSTTDYRCINPTIASNAFTCSIGNLSSNSTPYRYLLQITTVQAVTIAPIVMYDNAGYFNVEGTIIENNITSYSASATLPVVYGIESVQIIAPALSSTNVIITFLASLYPVNATATLYKWYINGNNTFNSTVNTMNISFSQIGTYLIGCQAENLLSMKFNTTSTSIQDVITSISLLAGNITNISTSQPLEIARFQLNMATGSDYACRINYNSLKSTTRVYYYTFGYIPGSYVTNQYIQAGAYNVTCHCENSMSNASISLIHYVQYPIVGLQLQQRGIMPNTNFRLNFTIAQGTAPQFRVLVDGVQVNYTYDPQYNLVQTITFPGQAFSINYTVEIYAWNFISSSYVSDVFSIVSAIVNPQIRSSVENITFPGPILFEYTIDAGANIEILFYFGDTISNNPAICQYGGTYPPNVWNTCPNANHTFEIPGTRTILVAFKNAISTVYKYLTVRLSTSVSQTEVITSLQISSSKCAAGFVENRAIASFAIQSLNSILKPASDAQILIIPDLLNQPTVTQGPYELIMDYFASPPISYNGLNVIYRAMGNYTAVLQVSNSVDSINVSCIVQVLPVLQDVYYSIKPLNWPYNSSTPFQASVYILDSNPGTVTLIWYFGDGTIVSRTRTATQPDQADTQSHFYTSVGTYNLTIATQGIHNTVTKSFIVEVQYAVLTFSVNFTSLTGSPHLIAYNGAPTSISINVQERSLPSASNPRLHIDFNDTSLLATNSVIDVALPYTGSYIYFSPGVYFVNFTVYNYVSSVTQIIKVAINAPFEDYSFSVCYLPPTLTSSLNDVCNLTLNNAFYYIPKQSQLVIYVTWSNPTGVAESFEVRFKNGSNIIFSQSLTLSQITNVSEIAGIDSSLPLFRLVIDLETNSLLLDGLHTVEVITRNPLYSATYSLDIYIIVKIAGLTIDDYNLMVPVNVSKSFLARYHNFSFVSCLYIQYSDNTIECYGDSSSCLSLPTDVPSTLEECSLPIQSFVYNDFSVAFAHTFSSSTAWIFAYAWNYMTLTTARTYFSFPLSSGGCNLPQVQFDVYNPTMRWARVIQRSEAFSIATRIIFNCTGSLNSVKQWHILECDTETEQCYPNQALDHLISQLATAQASEIYLTPKVLPVGTYLFNFTVMMTSQANVLTSFYTYVKIIRSAIKVNLLVDGTSTMTSGVRQSIIFQPGVYSIDPDSNYFDAENWTYQYYCRVYGSAAYPIFNGAEIPIDSTQIDGTNPSCLISPGDTTLFKYGPNSNQSILYISPRALQSGRSYEFKAIITNIYDKSLQHTGYALVEVQEGTSVTISVECIILMCSPNVEYQRINPTTQAFLTSSCIENCENATDIEIQWSVYRGFQTGFPNNDVKWILFSNMSAFDNILFYGRHTKNFTALNDLFLSYPTIEYWKFESNYIVTRVDGIATGFGAVRFVINAPPQNGTCMVSPTNGTSMTLFTFTCSDWIDGDGISGYSFYAYTSNSTYRYTIGFTTSTPFEVYLPIGDRNASYALSIATEVRDIHGAVTFYDIGTVTVIPDEEAIADFLDITQQSSTLGTTNNKLERILYSGNQNMASQILLSLSQALNSMGSDAIENATAENVPAQNLFVSGLSASKANSQITNTSSNSTTNTTEVVAAYTAALNAQANARDYAVQFINDLPITTVDSIKLQASTMKHLTESTSALTRDAATAAGSKCNDLVDALGTMVEKVSYEDVKMSVEGITQSASQVLVAVNTPLMNRGVVLNLDYERANKLPADYEANLEDPWSNPNQFADKNDFSTETIERNRNLYYQQKDSDQAVKKMHDVLSKSVGILSDHMNIGQTNTITTDSISMITSKATADNLDSLNISDASGSKINLPTLPYCKLLIGNDSCSNATGITANSIVLPLPAAGTNGRAYANVNVSRSVSLNLLDSTGASLPVSNLPKPIEIIIPRDSNLVIPPMTFENVTGQTGSTKTNNNRLFSIYYVNVTSALAGLTLAAIFELQPDDLSKGYLIIFRFDAIPTLNSSMYQIDGHRIFCPQDQIQTDTDGYLYSYFLDNTQTNNHSYAMFGIRELNELEFDDFCVKYTNVSNTTAPINDQIVNFTTNYRIRSYTSACYYLDENNYWQTKDVVVGPKTSHTQTQCFTTHLTTFAGGWIVLPAPINWNYVFANLDFSKNKTIYLTLSLVAVLYIAFMIYARYKDKKDVERLGVTPLADNLVNDKYYYQIIVFTGFRKDSGTKSKVHFIVSGDDDETGVRTLEDPKRTILQRGGIDSFILAVPKTLGRLNYMRIWHDNSGRGNQASWFLKYIIVRDLQTMERSHFICQQWFAVEKDDGAIDRLLPVAGDAQKTEFAYLLSKKTYYSLSDGHLWFSVFSRPPSTRFTRTQRCTCCFVLLLMSMLMNIMYYDQAQQAKGDTASGITMGPFVITPEQIAIGVIVELICFLPSTILVEMFRRLRPRRPPVSPVRAALQQMHNDRQEKQKQAALNDIHPQLTDYIVNADPTLSNDELNKMRNTLTTPLHDKGTLYKETRPEMKAKQIKKKRTLPWWFIFIAYGFSMLVFLVSGFFIFARGIEFGDEKTRKWLTSSATGFFSSILVTQPTKVVLMAIFFALFFRRDDDSIIETDDDDLFLDGNEEYLHAFDDKSLLTFRSKSGHIPLSSGELTDARQKRLNELKMWEIIRELFAYSSFLWILYVVSYSNRDPNSYFLMNHLKRDFLNLGSPTTDFTQISTMDQYWNWLTEEYAPRIRASRWYNGALPTNLSGYIDDKTNRVLGWGTMRQLRVVPNSCKVVSSFQNLTKSCEASYSIFNEEKRSFNPDWTSVFNASVGHIGNYSASIRKAFMYNKSEFLDTYTYIGDHATYGGGGYVYEFRGRMSEMLANLSLLRQLSWIDIQTRGVIIQMSLYSPNVDLFVFITILAEFLPSGGVFTSARFEPISLLNDFGGFGLFKLVCSIIYMVFIIYYMQREIRSVFNRRMAYFRDIWSYPDIGIIVCSWTGVGVYIWRLREANRISTIFNQTNGYDYVNLQLASYVNDLLTFLLGFCCFFGTIKFLRLLRFNQRMSMLSATLAYAVKDLLSFSCMFSIIYLGYLALFFLLFHAKIWACSDPLKTSQMLFEMMLLKFDVSDLYAADIFLGPFCFSLFVIFVVFICMNMFISIISDSFRIVRRNIALQSSEHEIIDFMTNQFKKWTGIGTTRELNRLHLNPLDGSHVYYHDPITTFPDKMDELIIALNKIYMDSNRNETMTLRPVVSNKMELIEEKNEPLDKTNKDLKQE